MTVFLLAFEKYCLWVSKIAQATRPRLATIEGKYPAQGEIEMDRVIHPANIALYRKLISESELDPSRDEDRHKMLMTLLAEEMAKDNKPPDVRPRGLPYPLTTQGEPL